MHGRLLGVSISASATDALDEARQHLPGPTSTKRVDAGGRRAPASTRASGPGASARAASSARGRRTARAVMHETTGTRALAKLDLVERARERLRRRAPSSGEWKAPATPRRIARSPRSRASSSAVVERLARCPTSTTCPGALSLATRTPCVVGELGGRLEVAPTQRRASRRVSPASSISRPRSATSWRASSASSAPAAASAESSPSEWPAATPGARAPSARQRARVAQKIAGWAKRVPRRRGRTGPRRPASSAAASRSGRSSSAPARASRPLTALPGEQEHGHAPGHDEPALAPARTDTGVLARQTPRAGGQRRGDGGGCVARGQSRHATSLRRRRADRKMRR